MFDSSRTPSLENLFPWVALDGEGLLTNFFAFPSSVLLLTFTIKLALTFLCHLAFFFLFFFYCVFFNGAGGQKIQGKPRVCVARATVKKENRGTPL